MNSDILKTFLLFQCLTITRAIFFNTKVDCSVTVWSSWSSTNSAAKQTRVRRIMRHPRNGGKSCPPLIEARDAVIRGNTSWSPWSPNSAFGTESRTMISLLKSSVDGHIQPKVVEEVRNTNKVPSLDTTAINFKNFFVRPNGTTRFFAAASGTVARRIQTTDMPRDLVLIMDSSGSIGNERFEEARKQLSRLIGLLCPINPFDMNSMYPYQSNQAAMLTYSTTVVENFDFNTYNTTVAIQNAILKLNYVGRLTNTHLAFDQARRLFDPAKGARNAAYVKREVLILTDGRSTNRIKTLEAVEVLKPIADIYGLMIGYQTLLGKDELSKYVTQPINQHLFHLTDFTELKTLVDAIAAEKVQQDADWCQSFN